MYLEVDGSLHECIPEEVVGKVLTRVEEDHLNLRFPLLEVTFNVVSVEVGA